MHNKNLYVTIENIPHTDYRPNANFCYENKTDILYLNYFAIVIPCTKIYSGRFLLLHQYRVEEKMIIDKNQNDKLMHEFNQEQREYIVEQINNFITRTRSAKVDNNMPEEEQRQETPSSEDQAI